MRKIKFRQWNEDSKTMTSAESLFIDAYYESENGCLVNKWLNREGKILMQFTGLLDKQNREIYEGDILYFTHFSKDVVIWDAPAFRMKNKDFDLYTWIFSSEIIGNIYENPELLNLEGGDKGAR